MTRFAALLTLTALFAFADEVNKPMGELDIKTEGGQMMKLSSWKGSPILLVVFSTTCPHCQKSAAAVEKTLRTYAPKGLKLIAVTGREEERKDFPEFRQKYGATYPMGSIKREDQYAFFGASVMQPFYVPSFAFIDKAGILREKFIGGFPVNTPAEETAVLSQHVEKLFKPLPGKTAAVPSAAKKTPSTVRVNN